MADYTPTKWAILQITEGRAVVFYKLLAGWPGGFDEDWRINSGIAKCEETEDGDFLFHGESGSVYSCKKEDYGFTDTSLAVFQKLKKLASTRLEGTDISFTTLALMPGNTNWSNLV